MNISILGSTGSIGTQTLDIVRENPGDFKVSALTAHSNWELLAAQAREFNAALVAIADPSRYQALKEALAGTSTRIVAGEEGILEAAGMAEAETVVTAMVGYSGLLPTVEAIKGGKRIALANKETLVAAGELITALVRNTPDAEILPVDSEHSAIFQCLVGEDRRSVRKIILTASGGAFRNVPAADLKKVTAADALKHPNWNMGAKVTVDSASMMNKGFEMIEARWLFDIQPDNIEIAVHPQSVVHSMVEFTDGSVKAQLGVPDMRLPIGYALGYPRRLPTRRPGLTLAQYANLTFETPDMEKFPLLPLAFEAIKKGGNAPCTLNAANEVAVESFLKGKIRFTDMPRIAEATLRRTPYIKNITLDDIVATNSEAVTFAREEMLRIAGR